MVSYGCQAIDTKELGERDWQDTLNPPRWRSPELYRGDRPNLDEALTRHETEQSYDRRLAAFFTGFPASHLLDVVVVSWPLDSIVSASLTLGKVFPPVELL